MQINVCTPYYLTFSVLLMSSFHELIDSPQPVLIDFSAEWCGPCKALAPVLKEVAQNLDGQARILKIDVDKNPELASQYQIRGVPTLILFKAGKMLWRQWGMMSGSQLEQLIRPHLTTN